MQATEGLSLEAQQAAIERYCEVQGFRLVRLCKDVTSGAKDQRPGLQEALDCLQRNADVLVVLKLIDQAAASVTSVKSMNGISSLAQEEDEEKTLGRGTS
jgi:DNA invertase Pin-like site-specific DNA recombinase